MKEMLNSLYITTDECELRLENNGIVITQKDGSRKRIPGNTIDSIFCFGNLTVTSPLLEYCCDHGITVSFFSKYGRFYGRTEGKTRGNVLLRQAQYSLLNGRNEKRIHAVKSILTAKANNCKSTLLHFARNHGDLSEDALKASGQIRDLEARLTSAETVDSMRGIEGSIAEAYFGAFDSMLYAGSPEMRFERRSRRPPRNRMNALLSYLYSLLISDICSAAESVGLDSAAGLMHSLRPGKPALACDLAEELRSPMCDRLAIAAVNTHMIRPEHFEQAAEEGVWLNPEGKRTVLKEWQTRKQALITHPETGERIPAGLIPFCQAQLLARFLRGEADSYPAFQWR